MHEITMNRHKVLMLLILSGSPVLAAAQAAQGTATPPGVSSASEAQVVEYPANFFSRYKPNTALDMINQTPGFLLDDGDASRGLGEAMVGINVADLPAPHRLADRGW